MLFKIMTYRDKRHALARMRLCRCLWTKDYGLLVRVLAVISILATIMGMFAVEHGGFGGECWIRAEIMAGINAGIWGFKHMLTLDLPANPLGAFAALFLYFSTWLVSGGGLVSIIVGAMRQFDEDRRNGDLRLKKERLSGHIVFLGWSHDNVEIIQQMLGRDGHKGPVLILSKKKRLEIKFRLRQVMGNFADVAFLIYHGNPDSEKERQWLNIEASSDLIIAGEEDDPTHDEQVIELNRRLSGGAFAGRRKRAKINSFNLYCQYLKEYGSDSEYYNFHHEWAKRALPVAERSCCCETKTPHYVIIGFSDMGQAMALQVAMLSGYEKTFVTVFDRNIHENERRFKTLFPAIDEMEKVHWSFVDLSTMTTPVLEEMLVEYAKQHMLTIVVVGDTVVPSIAYRHFIRHVNATSILISQDVNVCDDEGCRPVDEALSTPIPFGFLTGAGFIPPCRAANASGLDRLGIKLVSIVSSDVSSYLNPYMGILQKYAEACCEGLQRDFRNYGVKAVLGGALAYEASLKGSNDLDIRLLVCDDVVRSPGIASLARWIKWAYGQLNIAEVVSRGVKLSWYAKCVEWAYARFWGASADERIDKIRDKIVAADRSVDTFAASLKTEGGRNYIWHFKKMVTVRGVPGKDNVELSLNVQKQSQYLDVAGKATELKSHRPDVVDRFIEAKWIARSQGRQAYKHLKDEWRMFLVEVSLRCKDEGAAKNGPRDFKSQLDAVLSKMSDNNEFLVFLPARGMKGSGSLA